MPAHDDPAELSVGGQALLEGVMMRAGDRWGAAARRPDGEIVTTGDAVPTWARSTDNVPSCGVRSPWSRRSWSGLKALKWSARVADPEEAEEISDRKLALTTAVALLIFAGIFAVVPAAVSRAVGFEGFQFALAEAVVRLALFGGYLFLIGRSPGIQRTFAYHGAEHKVIAAHEHGVALTVEAVRPFSVRHARCGTDFLLLVVVVAIVVFSLVGDASWPVLIATRVLGLPLVAGLAYEVLKLAKRRPESKVVAVLTAPGLALQALTTRPPDDAQIEVAIAALVAVRPHLAQPDPRFRSADRAGSPTLSGWATGCWPSTSGGRSWPAGWSTTAGPSQARATRPTGDGTDGDALFATLAGLIDEVRAAGADGADTRGLWRGHRRPDDRRGRLGLPAEHRGWRGFPLLDRLRDHTGLPTTSTATPRPWPSARAGSAPPPGRGTTWPWSCPPGWAAASSSTAASSTAGRRQRRPHRPRHRRARRRRLRLRGPGLPGGRGLGHRHRTAPPAGPPPRPTTRSGAAPAGWSGRAVASVANLLDLPLVVVAGSVALGFGETFFAAAQEEIDQRCRIEFSRDTVIRPGGLGADGPLVGAAAVAWRALGHLPGLPY